MTGNNRGNDPKHTKLTQKHAPSKTLLVVAPTQYPPLNQSLLDADLDITPVEVSDLAAAQKAWKSTHAQLMILPVMLNGKSTLPFVQTCLAKNPTMKVVVVVNRDQINEAAEAMRVGVADCLFRPFSTARLHKTLAQVAQRNAPDEVKITKPKPARAKTIAPKKPEAGQKTPPPGHPPRPEMLIGTSPASIALSEAVRHASESRDPVLLRGEKGTGKCLAARVIYARATKQTSNFHKIDCNIVTLDTLPKSGGTGASHVTHYLDEICNLTLDVQAALSRMISDPAFADMRLIAATRQNPEAAIQQGGLLRDFYNKIAAIEIIVPTLAERREDLGVIARKKLRDFSEAEGGHLRDFDFETQRAIKAYGWPGNFPEFLQVLRNLVRQFGKNDSISRVTLQMLPAEIAAPSRPDTTQKQSLDSGMLAEQLRGYTLSEIERLVIETIIQAEGGNVTRAAKVLDVAPSTLYRKRQAWMHRGKG